MRSTTRKEKFINDFVFAPTKVMNLDLFRGSMSRGRFLKRND
jgi:hypothetical protein